MIVITESNKALLQLALQIAAEKFSENVETMNAAHRETKSAPDTAFKRMANQFYAQKQQAEALADLIQQYDEVALANDNDCLRNTRGVEFQR